MTIAPVKMGIGDFREAMVNTSWHGSSITEIHWHHTYRPDHAAFWLHGGEKLVVDMHEYHTKVRGWSTWGQHVTIDPEGFVWQCRPFHIPPASATGHNGTLASHPFMFEMIGDFREGKDSLTGAQLDAALLVTAMVQRRFGLVPNGVMFHSEMQATECPGRLHKPSVVADVKAMHSLLAGVLHQEDTYAPLRTAPTGDRTMYYSNFVQTKVH